MARINFRIAYWNVYGAYNETNRDGFGKCAAQGKLIESVHPDLLVTLENHEELYTRKSDGKREKAYMPLTRALPGMEIHEGDGGNQLYSRRGFANVIRTRNVRMPSRSASKWNLETKGVKYWVDVAHFVAGQTAARKATRAAQTTAFLAFTATQQRGIMAYDSNDFHQDQRNGTQWLMDRAGWKDMRVKSLKPTDNANLNSHHSHTGASVKGGTWIENLRTRNGVRVHASGLVPTPFKLSDHNLLWADVEIDSEVLLGLHDA